MAAQVLDLKPPGDFEHSAVTVFLRLRRSARQNHAHSEMLYRAAANLRRKQVDLTALVKAMPFYAAQLAKTEAAIKEVQAAQKSMRALKLQLGEALVGIAEFVDEDTTVEQRLELLNCNVADRAAVLADGPEHQGLVYLMGPYCVEDSAAHRRDQWNERPLHSVVSAYIHDRMLNTPEGRKVADEVFAGLFAPGGMFEGVPTATMLPDGTLVPDPPKLVLHQGGGAKSMEEA